VTVAPLDKFSFPSGHTLHAVAFTTLAWHYHPLLGMALMPFTCVVALSRIVLGLHYPSDVLAGALIGFGGSLTSLALERLATT
jgi:undecaprenyl-diphosphatase